MFGKHNKSQTPTSEKGGKAAPEVDSDILIADTKSFVQFHLKLDDIDNYIRNKYDFQIDEHKVWSLEDIKKAYGKFKRLSDKRKLPLALLIITNMRRRNEIRANAETNRLLDIEREKVKNLAEELRSVKAKRAKKDAEITTLKNQIKLLQTGQLLAPEGGAITKPVLPSAPPHYKERECVILARNDEWTSSDSEASDNDMTAVTPQLRALTQRRVEGELHFSHKPSKPQDIDKWSQDLRHPRIAGMDTWAKVNRLKTIYCLHPYDGVQLMATVMTPTETNKLNSAVTIALGRDGQNLANGWESIEEFIRKATNASTNWGKVAACIQKTGEAVDVFGERFSEIFLRHSGIKELKRDNLSSSVNGPLKSTFMQALLPEIRSATKLSKPDWQDENISFDQLISAARRVELDTEYKIRNLNSRGHRHTNFKRNNNCRNCGKPGHYWRQCKEPQQHRNDAPSTRNYTESDVTEDLNERFASLNDGQKRAILSAVPLNERTPH